MKTKVEKKDIERVKGLLNGVDSGIVATKNGVALFGNMGELLNLLSNIGHSFKESPAKKEDVMRALENGYSFKGVEIKLDGKKLDKKELDNIAREIVKDLKDALDEMFSEEDKD